MGDRKPGLLKRKSPRSSLFLFGLPVIITVVCIIVSKKFQKRRSISMDKKRIDIRSGFSLVELLVTISIISRPVRGSWKRIRPLRGKAPTASGARSVRLTAERAFRYETCPREERFSRGEALASFPGGQSRSSASISRREVGLWAFTPVVATGVY